MKFLHVSDLHIGKRLHEHSLLDDQEYMMQELLEIGRKEEIDAFLVAGDIYDKNIPTERGVALFDSFLTKAHKNQKKVFLISGNHDSPERIHFGGRIMEEEGIYIQGTYNGEMKRIRCEDSFGIVDVTLLPFVKPASLRPYFDEIKEYEEGVVKVLEHQPVDPKVKNILVAHQFVTGGNREPERCESEIVHVGGVDNMDASIFHEYDYVALGHLHMAQSVGRDTVYYAGSPLKYSFSEAKERQGEIPVKSAMLITVEEAVTLKKIPLKPLRDMRVIRGKLEELIRPEHVKMANQEDYIRAILTNEEELYDPLKKLRQVYPNLLRLDFDNIRTKENQDNTGAAERVEERSLLDLFGEFYEKQNNVALTKEQENVILKIAGKDGEA